MTEWQKQTSGALREFLSVMGQRQLPSNRDGFDDEFDSLRAVDYKVRCNRDEFFTASLGSNMSKNRFRDVLPNEGTRVKLEPLNHRGDGDYINANYIDGRRLFGVPFVYIATQAPLVSSVADFWRMTYENNCVFIVMLCAEIEAGKKKSVRYWPDAVGDVLPVGAMNVVLLSENHRADTVFRTMALRTLEGKERTIYHLQYTRWPDQSIPQSSAGLMEIIRGLGQSAVSTQTPIIVHCSGGVGRTGVFIALHVSLALFELEQPVSIPRIVQYLKYCRSGMVQRKDQYLFVYYAVLREMEKMVWAVEQTRLTEAKMYPIPQSVDMSGVGARGTPTVERRQKQHVSMHPAQVTPDITKSMLAPQATAPYGMTMPGSRAGAAAAATTTTTTTWAAQQDQPEHSIRVATMLPSSLSLSRGGHTGGGGFGGGAIGRAGGDATEELETVVRRLQNQNQGRRQTPARDLGGGGGGGFRFSGADGWRDPSPSGRASSFNQQATLQGLAAGGGGGTLSEADVLMMMGENVPSRSVDPTFSPTVRFGTTAGGGGESSTGNRRAASSFDASPIASQSDPLGRPHPGSAPPHQYTTATVANSAIAARSGSSGGWPLRPLSQLPRGGGAGGATPDRSTAGLAGGLTGDAALDAESNPLFSPDADFQTAVGDFNANIFGQRSSVGSVAGGGGSGGPSIKRGDFTLL